MPDRREYKSPRHLRILPPARHSELYSHSVAKHYPPHTYIMYVAILYGAWVTFSQSCLHWLCSAQDIGNGSRNAMCALHNVILLLCRYSCLLLWSIVGMWHSDQMLCRFWESWSLYTYLLLHLQENSVASASKVSECPVQQWYMHTWRERWLIKLCHACTWGAQKWRYTFNKDIIPCTQCCVIAQAALLENKMDMMKQPVWVCAYMHICGRGKQNINL